MRIDTSRIVKSKERLTASLLSLRNEMLAYVLKATICGARPRVQARKLKDMALKHLAKPIGGLTEREMEEARKAGGRKYGVDSGLLFFFAGLSTDLYRELKGTPGNSREGRSKRSETAFRVLNEALGESRTQGVTNPANGFEATMKELTLEDSFRINRRKPEPEVFYLCSWHGDCAEDHLPYQGNLYVDRQWKTWVTDRETRKEINIYIAKYKVRAMQKIMHRPVWLITRPNCRHYFDSITTKEVLSGKPWGEMLEERGMRHEIGLRGMQNIFHRTDKGWYTEDNVRSIVRAYEERLEAHVKMYEADPTNDLIKRAIMKDKALIRKWRDYLSRNF